MGRRGAWAWYALAASSCGVATLLTGCSTAADSSPAQPSPAASSASPSPSGTTSSTAKAQAAESAKSVAPLTGLMVTAATAQRPAVAVAVASSDPVGLGAADLVFDEVTSPVRFLAVFQSAEPSQVGPVTGTMPSDGQALSVMHPVTGYDGGTSSFVSVLDATKIVDDGYATHASLYSAEPGGLDVSTATLAAADRSDGPPPEVFSYRAAGTTLASVDESHPNSVRIDIPGEPAQQWSFDARADRWVETAGGPRVSVANLVVQIVSFKTVYLSRKYAETAQSARVIGTGQATVFSGSTPGASGGTAAAGTWHKPGLAAVTDFFDAAHLPMDFQPGPTWIVLAPAGTRTSQAGG